MLLFYIVLLLCCNLSVVAAASESTDIVSPLDTERKVVNVVEVHEKLDDIEDGVLLGMEEETEMEYSGGGSYVCYPEKEADDSKLGVDERNETAKEKMEIENQLMSLKGTFLVKKLGYWTFKIWPFEKVEQIHYEGIVNKIHFSLGVYQGLTKEVSEEDGSIHWVQTFVNGTNGRETRLYFSCQMNVDSVIVKSVEETSLHRYDIFAVTPLACAATPEWQAKRLLSALTGQCISRPEGWWTYELCFERHLIQYHKEKDGRVTQFLLGEFSPLENKKLEDTGELLARDKGTNQPTFQQIYNGGTKCDLVNMHRSAKISFICNINQHLGPSQTGQYNPTTLLSITESPSCYYQVKVHTPLLCGHSFFKEKSSSKQPTVAKIHCVPKPETS
mmetsp:Transcript_8162/g.13172  ORF Transcript_8162/g.13172 Transcript_8162/m.13172 type:complete len:388 (-) Transcript_8162:65-1228(-)|eukprot:CAMPEP_0203760568 /NCGR_PEP_ID=MMETSP0098-20131031/13833_1 /ASSEMBLY_ACC=CAM_ASM_000208 /TAXON_ID=96639 /ORGANISM=" , Strain NY0313808BC1" /LENGTH=387 /DNA_ID=CAMNT_0050654187 /DNA_START=413 /DNA_END=1576 /DNA_ORIENTATION=-